MRYHMLAIGIFMAGTQVAGCKPPDTKAAPVLDQQKAATIQLEKAKVETKQAAEAIADYTYAQKDQFIATMKKELENTQAELARLTTQVENGTQTLKADATIRLDLARAKWMRARDELKQADNATNSTWEQIKGGFKSAYGEMHDNVAQTRQWLSEKIAP